MKRALVMWPFHFGAEMRGTNSLGFISSMCIAYLYFSSCCMPILFFLSLAHLSFPFSHHFIHLYPYLSFMSIYSASQCSSLFVEPMVWMSDVAEGAHSGKVLWLSRERVLMRMCACVCVLVCAYTFSFLFLLLLLTNFTFFSFFPFSD